MLANFENNMPRVFIFANGEPDFPDDLVDLIEPDDIVICADGGSNHAVSLGIEPTIVVGDMDSIASGTLADFERQGVDIRKFPKDKDESDLELALRVAVDFNPSEIICMSVLGRRQDHSLTNTFLLGRYASLGNSVDLIGASWNGQFITRSRSCLFRGTPGDIVSLIPMIATVSGVAIDGVKWPLNDTTLPCGSSRTLSNQFISDTVSVKLDEGLLLAFHHRVHTQ